MIKVLNYKTFRSDGKGLVISIMQSKGAILGNPFYNKPGWSRERKISEFRVWLWAQIKKRSRVHDELQRIARISKDQDVYLVCCCKPLPCHGDVIVSAVGWMSR